MTLSHSINLSDDAHHKLTLYKVFNRCRSLSEAVELAVEKASKGEKR